MRKSFSDSKRQKKLSAYITQSNGVKRLLTEEEINKKNDESTFSNLEVKQLELDYNLMEEQALYDQTVVNT
jgi:hypothetical protein